MPSLLEDEPAPKFPWWRALWRNLMDGFLTELAQAEGQEHEIKGGEQWGQTTVSAIPKPWSVPLDLRSR